MTSRTRDNGTTTVEPIGDLVATGESPVLDTIPEILHHVVFDATLANEPYGAACIRIAGPPTLSAAQAMRLGEELIHLATHVAEVRSLRGLAE